MCLWIPRFGFVLTILSITCGFPPFRGTRRCTHWSSSRAPHPSPPAIWRQMGPPPPSPPSPTLLPVATRCPSLVEAAAAFPPLSPPPSTLLRLRMPCQPPEHSPTRWTHPSHGRTVCRGRVMGISTTCQGGTATTERSWSGRYQSCKPTVYQCRNVSHHYDIVQETSCLAACYYPHHLPTEAH